MELRATELFGRNSSTIFGFCDICSSNFRSSLRDVYGTNSIGIVAEFLVVEISIISLGRINSRQKLLAGSGIDSPYTVVDKTEHFDISWGGCATPLSASAEKKQKTEKRRDTSPHLVRI